VGSVAAGILIYTVGNTGIDVVNDIIVADLSPLQWRGLVTSLMSAPFIVNAFVGAEIVNGILTHSTWRWGCGFIFVAHHSNRT
jgi:MFS family permease